MRLFSSRYVTIEAPSSRTCTHTRKRGGSHGSRTHAHTRAKEGGHTAAGPVHTHTKKGVSRRVSRKRQASLFTAGARPRRSWACVSCWLESGRVGAGRGDRTGHGLVARVGLCRATDTRPEWGSAGPRRGLIRPGEWARGALCLRGETVLRLHVGLVFSCLGALPVRH